ncbi:MAG: response regulator [Bryobacteraceae bacterium]|jgi:DNA-binding NtrC family response regulator
MNQARPNTFIVETLLASAHSGDQAGLSAVLADSAWKLITVPTYKEAVWTIRRLQVPIVFCDLRLEDQPWPEMLRKFRMARRRSGVIFLSTEGDRSLAAEVTRQGGFDLLVRPFNREQIFQSLLLAYSQYRLDWPVGLLRRPKIEESTNYGDGEPWVVRLRER